MAGKTEMYRIRNVSIINLNIIERKLVVIRMNENWLPKTVMEPNKIGKRKKIDQERHDDNTYRYRKKQG